MPLTRTGSLWQSSGISKDGGRITGLPHSHKERNATCVSALVLLTHTRGMHHGISSSFEVSLGICKSGRPGHIAHSSAHAADSIGSPAKLQN